MRPTNTVRNDVSNGHVRPPVPFAPAPSAPAPRPLAGGSSFDRDVLLRQSPRWSRAVVWTIVGVTSALVGWACIAKVEVAIPAQGKLEPEGVVQPVQAPVGGVVSEIHIEEGQAVAKGDLLITFNQKAAAAEIASVQEVQKKLIEENQYYRSQLQGTSVADSATGIAPEISQLTSNRAAYLAENQLYQTQLQGGSIANLTPEQQQRLITSQIESNSRISAVALDVEQLSRQLERTQVELANARNAAQVQQDIVNRLGDLEAAGAVAKIPYLQEEQKLNDRQAEVESLQKEAERLTIAIAQAQQQLTNATAVSREELLDRIAANNTQIAQIDSQLTKQILENDKQLEEINSQLQQIQQTLDYQELRAPVNGTVFNLKATEAGYVANTSEPILEIVPQEGLVARVFITNRDVGFVKQGQIVDVRIDAFPYSEFGDVDGKLIRIGSDALPPDQVYPFYRFPAEIELEQQTLNTDGQTLSLQSGMSVTANIKLRKQRVITLLIDLFTRKVDSLKSGG
ncbi:MAG: HlyD family efflux transporter periplasmic adaptor subunit [Leptolyngbyaceae cyanobacterium SM1_1_3]|nr:HlyD family efflux transporter periplasmic adaptor subunit [Leptolyngbyaceae cyanobacterium SM1_1_3]NJN04929.1 HlyD family efflux transporter periplasmic adaptor subunit [Leptolyngbyaceae cyanobacterium RM1_1_2]NJO11746.1 HlyD family efflux transporter periplasmic adaptor subunit [Leptolyngbyaceae cyanobacterium SL_1_1]